MIEVVTHTKSGTQIDRAEAETPEAAVVAARVLLVEAATVGGYASSCLRADFLVDGRAVRSNVRIQAL